MTARKNTGSVPTNPPNAASGETSGNRRSPAQFWGLTAAELAEIQRSLKELTE